MRARLDTDGGADQRQPGQRHLTYLFDPREWHRIDIEPVGNRADEVTQEYADQKVDDRKSDECRNRILRDGLENTQHKTGFRTVTTGRMAEARLRPFCL